MIALDKKILTFDIKEVHLSDHPHDISGCSFIKFYDFKKKVNAKGFTCQKELTTVIDLTQDLDEIYQNMNRNTKYCIRKGERDGIIVEKNNNYKQFYEMYISFKEQKGLKSLFEIFGVGKVTLEDMKNYGTLFTASYNGELLAGGIYLENKSIIKALLGASKRLEVDKNKKRLVGYANRLIEWETIKYAKEKGIKEFDMGGLWSEKEAENDEKKKGINSFKLGFGGKIVNHYTYQKIYSRFYEFIYKLYTHKIFKWMAK